MSGAAPRRVTGVLGAAAVVTGLLALVGGVASPAQAADPISFRAAAQAAANQKTARVTVPAPVQVGDGLLLFVSTNKSVAAGLATPAGWTREGTRLANTDTETTLFSRVAAAGDAGRVQAVTFPSAAKSTLTLMAYDGTSSSDPVAGFASAAETTNRATHTTPASDVAAAGSWVVSYWADKSSSATAGWTLPAGQVERSRAVATGTGRISSVAADTGSVVSTGSTTPRTATSAVSSAKATMWSVVLAPDTGSAVNVAPVAAFAVDCVQATCTVDGSASSDTAPGSVSSYAWDFGDDTAGTGATTSHTFATGGTKTITLRVTDNEGLVSSPAARTVAVTLPQAQGQPEPGHSRLVPDKPRTDTPRISDGEITDIEVVPQLNRVFIAGNFTSLANTTGNTAVVSQAGLASYNLTTGLIDTAFRPQFNGGVAAVEASPDGTKLFVGGSFNSVNGVSEQKVASLDLATGAPLSTFGFSASTNNAVMSLAASNDTVYVGGRFTRVNGVLMSGLAAVSAVTGAVDSAFANPVTGGIGVNGALGVQQLKITHDGTKLLVVHTGRQIAGQDRLGMGLIDLRTKQLLPFRSTLWDDNLARVGGVTRIYGGDISPDDSFFVVTSGSGGDAPPISDTAVAYPLDASSLQSSNVQPLWISRQFDSIYSVAITEQAVYLGGHFSWIESPTSNDPWPGLDNVGYGTGQGLSGYGLGDQVVRRDHIAAVSRATGKALEWNPTGGSNSFEGNKAMEATSRGLFIGGDGMFQGGVRTGRVAFYDFNSVAFPAALPDTTISTPIEGRVVATGTPFTVAGSASVATGSVGRVEVSVQDRDTGQYLQDDGTAFTTFASGANTLNAGLSGTGATRSWSVPATVAGNRNLLVSAQAFTAATGGMGDSTKATKKFESFGTDDQTPSTSINGPSGIQPSTSFTVTGTATDDKGVNALTYWFRDEQGRYLQNDGTVDDIYNTFRGTPDVIGATSATWSYDVTLPHEGVWRGSATAVDTAGQADLRSAVRDWTVDANAVAPTVTVSQPAAMTPPFAAPAITVAPGGRLTFSGTASDDQGLKDVEISLRNSSTGERLSNDGSWGLNVSAGQFRVSPVDIGGSTYSWTYTTPFDLSAGSYAFTVRATDDSGLTTSSTNYGRLTVNAQVPGDLPPDTTMSFTAPGDESLSVILSGTATDDRGVASVRVALQDRDTGRYLQPDGSMAAAVSYRSATLASAGGTSTSWTLPVTLPTSGNWSFVAAAFDTAGQQDSSTTGATAVYAAYPNDGPPTLSDTLGQPQTGSAFTDGKIVVTGRAEDAPDAGASIARVEVAVVNASGQYMGATGTFSTTVSFRTAFLNSPGSTGSNYSYTTPVIPAGTYSVRVRPVDARAQVGVERISTNVTVTQPPNNPPVPSFTYTCQQNVCTFDARSSTDENAATLTYTWSFGSQGTASGSVPRKTFTAAGTFPVTLTVRDEWQAAATSAPQNVVVSEPSGNVAPAPVFAQSCSGLTCAVSSAGTADPNAGDTVTYAWDWGDGTAISTGAAPAAHVYASSGTYAIRLTTTDGWGKSASVTRSVSLNEPAGNTAPVVALSVACASFTTCQGNSAGTTDPQGDELRYSWSWGDATASSTTAAPSHVYTLAGTYTVTLTVTDVWGRASSASQTVTITERSGNTGPTAAFTATCTGRTCAISGVSAADDDGIRSYSWSWGDGSAASTGAAPSAHVYAASGTFTITLTVLDNWGRAGTTTRSVTLT